MTNYIYIVEQAQLSNAGKYQCIATYEEKEGELSAGTTVSNEESVVILGELLVFLKLKVHELIVCTYCDFCINV